MSGGGRAATVIVANSPGEVAGWVRPLVASLRASEARVASAFEGLEVIVVVPPCPFASGREAQVVAGFPGVDAVVTPSEYVRYALLGVVPQVLQRIGWRRPGGRPGIIVHLGGDPMHSALLARKLRLPAVAYSDRSAGFTGSFVRFMVEDARVRDKLRRKGVADERIDIVGNLMVDGVRPASSRDAARAALEADGDSPVVCLMPGSRRRQVFHGLPFFLRVAEIVKRFRDDAEFVMVLSPFVTIDTVAKALAAAADGVPAARRVSRGLEGTGGELKVVPGCAVPYVIETDGRARVKVADRDRYDMMAASDVAVTMPGTVTAELAFLGIPTVVAVPLNLPEHIPLPGILGIVGSLPVVGRHLKRVGVRKASERIEFTAIPNKRQRRMITPEVRGVLTAEDIAIKLLELLQDKDLRGRIAVELRQAMGRPGTAERVSAIILDTLVATGGRRA